MLKRPCLPPGVAFVRSRARRSITCSDRCAVSRYDRLLRCGSCECLSFLSKVTPTFFSALQRVGSDRASYSEGCAAVKVVIDAKIVFHGIPIEWKHRVSCSAVGSGVGLSVQQDPASSLADPMWMNEAANLRRQNPSDRWAHSRSSRRSSRRLQQSFQQSGGRFRGNGSSLGRRVR